MKKVTFALLMLFALLFAVSCNTASSSIKDFESFTNEVESDFEFYTDEDWEKVLDEYAEIEMEMEQHEYTEEQMREIGRLKGKMAGYATKRALKNAADGLGGFMNAVGGGIEGFIEAIKE